MGLVAAVALAVTRASVSFAVGSAALSSTAKSKASQVICRAQRLSMEDAEVLYKAADIGDIEAQFTLGMTLCTGDNLAAFGEADPVRGLDYLEMAANQGHLESQYAVGTMKMASEIPEVQGWAAHFLNMAANQGDARAIYQVGLCFLNGIGVEQDSAKAAEWVSSSANKGYGVAQDRMGAFLLSGVGVEENKEWAAHWYEKAAEQGVMDSQYNLGLMYESGEGVEQSLEKAIEWLEMAANQGDLDSVAVIKDIKSKM